jgi:hypothetical protein
MLRLNLFPFLLLCIFVVTVAEKKEGRKTECLGSTEDGSAFHCIPISEPLRVSCIDTETRCPDWTIAGECKNNPQFMLIHCRKSCQSCIELHAGGVTQIAPLEETRHQVLQKLVETQEYQHQQAEKTVRTLETCLNKHELCTHWSLQDDCETNAHFMRGECSAACRVC